MTDETATLLPLALVFALLPALAAGSHASWGKDPAQWTDADAQAVLTASPWVQTVSATMVDPRDTIEETPPPLPGPAQAGMAGRTNSTTGTTGRWDGGIGRNRMGTLPTLPVTVRWESATPVREALRRVSKTPLDVFPADYAITVSGLIPAGHYTTNARRPEEIVKAFVAASRLQPRGGEVIVPRNVTLDPATGTVQILFPRSPGVQEAQKELTFVTRFGGFTVRAKFRLKDMRFQGKLAL